MQTRNIARITDEILTDIAHRIGGPIVDTCHLCGGEPIGAIITDGEVTGWHATYTDYDSGDMICQECADALLRPVWID